MSQGGDHAREGVFEACSETHPNRHDPLTQFIPTWCIDGYNAILLPAGDDITINGENIASVEGVNDTLKFSLDTVFPCQPLNSSTRRTPMRLDSAGPIVADDMQTTWADHPGVDANYFLSPEISSSGDRQALSHSTPEDKEVPRQARKDKGILDSSSLYPPNKVSPGSVETQYGYLGEPQEPQRSLQLISNGATVPHYRSNASSNQAIRGRTGSYSCGVCGDRFVQRQGARRHHREKHEPRECPYCHAFKWGRPYLYKKHLETKHPEIDPEAGTLDATVTRRDRRKDAGARESKPGVLC